MNCELPDVQAGFRKGRGTRDQIANIRCIMEKAREFQKKKSISALLTMLKPLTVWITINCGKFWRRWEYQTTWPASWGICMQVRKCQELARDIPLVTKVMRKEAWHSQRRDRASGVPPDILEHLPPKKQCLPTLLLCALTSDFTGGCPPPPSRSLCQKVNLQLQLIKFLGN